jgi:hypothetical protein
METLIEEGVRNKGKKVVVEPITEQQIFEELKSVQKVIKLKVPSFENKKTKLQPSDDTNL